MSRPKPGDLIADKYQIERFIGQGGMAEVFAGLNIRTGKRVALKWISPALATTKEALSRFRREALAAGRINHPNVVTVFDVVEHASSTWLVMELLEGDPLSEILNRVGYMEAEPAVQLLIPAIRGVAAAHAHGVIHRDLTPDNIFICRSADGKPREAKVLDFGVSKLSDDSGDQVGITGLGHAVGTPAYMAPEQIRGNVAADGRTDVYALGVVLYQMLAGRRPFDGQIYSALMIEIATTDAPPLRSVQPHVPVALEEIVQRAMARDMEQRFPDVKSLLDALEDLIRVDVSYAPNKISGAHSGRVPAVANDQSASGATNGQVVDPLDGLSPARRATPLPATGDPGPSRADSSRNQMLSGPVTPPLGSIRPADAARRAWSWQRVVPVVAAACLVVAVVALAVVRARHEPPHEELAASAPRAPAPRPPPQPASQPTAPAMSELMVVVTPSSAKLTVDGVAVPGNPFTGHYGRDQIHRIAASATGYEPKTQDVGLARDLVVTLTLERRRGPAPGVRTVAGTVARTVVARRGAEIRRAPQLPTPGNASLPSPSTPPTLPTESRGVRAAAVPASSPAAVDPAGGHAPIHPIQTTSPYEAQ
jgi:serine/threonine protein kinase